jgi:putative aminopeptidase FrvX
MDEARFLHLARPIMSLPTASYHEHFVWRAVRDFASRRIRLEISADILGNLLLCYDGRRGSQKGEGECLIVTAHMDHPGLGFKEHLPDEEHLPDGEFVFERLGGFSPSLAREAAVRIYTLEAPPGQRGIKGVVVGEFGGDGDRPAAYRVRVESPPLAARIGPGSFAMWDLKTWNLRGRRLHCRACDDLGGVAVGLAFLDELSRRRAPVKAGLLLTRAEEVGFAGMVGAVDAGFLDENALYINIECSSILAGAVMGAGPVIRVGDRMWTFDPHITAGLVEVARQLATRGGGFRFQRKLMDSGSCEATVLMGTGFRTGAVALPLGNYHNTGEKRLAPEIIHLDDALNLIDLLVHLARYPGGCGAALRASTKALDKSFADRFKHQKPRLLANPPSTGNP